MILVTKTCRHFIVCSLLLCAIGLSFSSCVNTRKATYFNDLKDTTLRSQLVVPESVIQKNDIISISVSSLNPEASSIYNTPNVTPGPNGVQFNGYLVNNDGNINYPVLGNIKAAGLSKEQLKNFIAKSFTDRKLLLDPIVSIRFQNFRVTVLGEVKNPAVIPVPNEKISLLEAIGLAGDLTIYAKRDNVLVIREEEGVKTIKRLNLNSTELFSSPYYYLKTNDVVYVEPNKARVASSSRSQQWLPILFSAMTFATIIADRIIRNN
jgi:polysaccharide export outer membrane protein